MIKTAVETVADLKKVLEQYPNDLPVVVKHGWHPVVLEREYGGKKCVALEAIIEHEASMRMDDD